MEDEILVAESGRKLCGVPFSERNVSYVHSVHSNIMWVTNMRVCLSPNNLIASNFARRMQGIGSKSVEIISKRNTINPFVDSK